MSYSYELQANMKFHHRFNTFSENIEREVFVG